MNQESKGELPCIFLDSSALMAGVISATGAARVLLKLGSTGFVRLMLSEQVLAEVERNLARKAPAALPAFRQTVKEARPRVVKDPPPELVQQSAGLIAHRADIPILLSAMQAHVDFLVTLNRRHFIDDPKVAEAAGLLVGTPGDALAWLRQRLAGV